MVFCCSICQERLECGPTGDEPGPIIATLKCGHAFHILCIKEWVVRSCRNPGVPQEISDFIPIKCPVCRQEDPPRVFRVFEITFTFKDSSLIESQDPEAIFVQQNIDDLELECTKLQDALDLKTKELHLQENEIARLEAENAEKTQFIKELDNYLKDCQGKETPQASVSGQSGVSTSRFVWKMKSEITETAGAKP